MKLSRQQHMLHLYKGKISLASNMRQIQNPKGHSSMKRFSFHRYVIIHHDVKTILSNMLYGLYVGMVAYASDEELVDSFR